MTCVNDIECYNKTQSPGAETLRRKKLPNQPKLPCRQVFRPDEIKNCNSKLNEIDIETIHKQKIKL